MNTLLAVVALLGLLGQESPEVAPASAPEVIRVRAISGYDTGRGTVELDPELAPLADYLADLGYDTYRSLGFHEVSAPFGQETSIPIDAHYAVHIRPVNVSERGEVLFDARVEWSEGGRTMQALKVAGRASRGHGLVLRGLALPAGELIIILSIARPDEQDGGAGGGAGDQPDDSLGEQGGAQQDPAGEAGGPQNQNAPMEEPELTPEEPRPELRPEESGSPPPPVAESTEETPLPPDLANMEAILRALEEQDMREQKNARNRRYDVIVRGDWW